jgi:hypothetical protein
MVGSVGVVFMAGANRATVRLWVAAGVIVIAALIGGGDRIWDDGGAVPIRDGDVLTQTCLGANAGGGGVRAWRDPHSHQAGRGMLRDTGRAHRVSAAAR